MKLILKAAFAHSRQNPETIIRAQLESISRTVLEKCHLEFDFARSGQNPKPSSALEIESISRGSKPFVGSLRLSTTEQTLREIPRRSLDGQRPQVALGDLADLVDTPLVFLLATQEIGCHPRSHHLQGES